MTTLNIGGKRVRVGDEFRNLSPEQQAATVDEIASSMGMGSPAQGQMDRGHANVPAYQPPASWQGNYDPATGEITRPGPQPSRTTAALGSFIEGIPVAGPYLRSGAENVAAGIGSTITGQPHADVLGDMRGMVDQSQEAYPWTSTAAGIGGAVAGTIPAIAAAPTLFGASTGPLWARMLAGGGSGTAIGTADSGVRSDWDPEAMKWGGGAGLAAGVFGPIVGRAVGSGFQRLRDWRAFREAAKQSGIDSSTLSRVGKAARNDGLDPAALNQRMQELGPDAMLMDLGDNLQQQAGALAATPGRGQSIIRGSIANRQAGAGTRIGNALDDALGQPVDTLALADDIVTQRAAAARPLYQRAYQEGSGGVWSPELERMAGSPMFADAMRGAATRGQDRAVLDGFGSFNPRVTVTQDGRIAFNQSRAGGSPLYPDLQYWDYVKRELDDIAGAATRAGRREEASIATNLASRLRNELDSAVPSYKAARDAYSGPSAIVDALEEGQNVFKNTVTPGQLRRQLQGMAEAERDAFIQGARAQVVETMGTARNDALAARSIFQRGFNRDKLEVLLGPDEAGRLLRSLEAETAFANSRDVVTRNSLTASRQAAQRDIAGDAAQFGIREGYIAGGTLGTVRAVGVRALDKMVKALASAHQEAKNVGLADALTSKDREAVVKALSASMGPEVNREMIDRLTRALLIGGGTSAARP